MSSTAVATVRFVHGWPYWPAYVCPFCGYRNDARANVRDDDQYCCNQCYRLFDIQERA